LSSRFVDDDEPDLKVINFTQDMIHQTIFGAICVSISALYTIIQTLKGGAFYDTKFN